MYVGVDVIHGTLISGGDVLYYIIEDKIDIQLEVYIHSSRVSR